ncbi:hypothetical protein [Flavobacterium cellulosilyticum]|uniref:DUF3298 domain-containing protein n=1 Tax=Flavobacterium cellulosilyticum TaxID=2541731 RepID=A0A4R5CEU4_9FLAO|nr:hypothetical protein [Flavobacterium cellulosilyticum]TDD95732.1 hypothetical protein E0F76_13185 [Flavobacterium cellulosilyticum]
MRYILVLILAYFAPSFMNSGEILAHISKIIYLQGKVGERTLVIKMMCYDESPIRDMTYFFDDAKKDCFFKGRIMGNAWRFYPESVAANKALENKEELLIAESKNGFWKGYWLDSSGKKININLNPILNIPTSKYNYFSQMNDFDSYEAYKISKINLTKTKTAKTLKNVSIDWFLEKESGISFFRLRSLNKNLKVDSLNVALETMHLALLQNYYHLKPDRKELIVSTELLYLTKDLISFKIISNSIIKGQNPSKSQQLVTLDIQSGKQIDLESLVWFGKKTAKKPSANDVQETFEYRKYVFASKIFSMLKTLYPDKMKNTVCGLNKVDTWAIPAYAVTKKGLLLGFFPSGNCSILDWAIIPYKSLTPYLEKKYSLTAMN